MKKTAIILAAILSLAACNKSETIVPIADHNTLYAQIEQETATKTYMDLNNNIRWSEGDQIVGFMKSSLGLKYLILPSSVGKTYASFENVSVSNDYINAGTEWDHNVVYYPYSDVVETQKLGSNYSLSVSLPAEQIYAEDSFGNGSMAMVAVSEDNNITFKNVLGGMKLQLKGSQKVTSIQLVGKNSEKLSGAATVTAYTDETKPAITMSSGASTSVTLDCGSGVQLNESAATEFIIALPPVLFSNGFTVTVTDSESQTYTVETDKANTVLRSSLLVMPTFKLGETPNDESVERKVYLNTTSLTLSQNASYTLSAEVEPLSGDQTVIWSSSLPSVAVVDGNGNVTTLADGTTVISAVCGGAGAYCTVTVISCRTDIKDYVVDGVSYGKGIALGNVIWAPVNCGYEPATTDSKGYPYGQLYQWGRKYGQGYSTYNYQEKTVPEMLEGPLPFENAIREKYSDTFFTVTSSPYDWASPQNNYMWNSGKESAPIRTENDPCPEGWRVPTSEELAVLKRNKSSWTEEGSRKGMYFSGKYTYYENAPKVFLPAAGYRSNNGSAFARDERGCYWSSNPNYISSDREYLEFSDIGYASMDNGIGYRALGHSVRCVQE